MIDFEVAGAIFDVDDTLLDNIPGKPGQGLHERSRLIAVHEVGKRHGIVPLQELSVEDNLAAFTTASVHTFEAAVWNIFRMVGLADSDVMNPDNELLHEIVTLKDKLHMEIMLNEAEEVPGASKFVRELADSGIKNRLAIASMALRRDVDIFLTKTGLVSLFPAERVITKELVSQPKPNPEVYELAFASLGLAEDTRSRVCAFEDDPLGIMSALGAGLHVCAITTRYSADELLAVEFPPHEVASSYAEFSELFHIRN